MESRTVAAAQRRTTRSLAQSLSVCDSREEAMFRAHTESALTMSALAEELGLFGLPRQSFNCSDGGGKRQDRTP